MYRFIVGASMFLGGGAAVGAGGLYIILAGYGWPLFWGTVFVSTAVLGTVGWKFMQERARVLSMIRKEMAKSEE